MFKSYFNEGLNKLSSLSSLNLKDGYSVVPVVSNNWKTSSNRLLVIVESVDRYDLKYGSLLSSSTDENGDLLNTMTKLMPSLLDFSYKLSKSSEDFAFGCLNFNAAKTRYRRDDPAGISSSAVSGLISRFGVRCAEAIRKLQPSHVLVCGGTAAVSLFQALGKAESQLHLKSGWVFDIEFEGLKFKTTATLDLEPMYNPPTSTESLDQDDDDEDEQDVFGPADLLGFVSRNAASLFNGEMEHCKSYVTPKPVYIDTTAKFDKLLSILSSHAVIAVDTETRTLESYTNNLYVIQFAVSEDRGYVLPVEHPRTPFTLEEIQYIKRKLRAFFASTVKKELVFLNGAFDLRIIRAQLKIPFIHHDVYEVTAGEQLLDENIGILGRKKWKVGAESVSLSYQNLRNLFTLYGNDFYWKAVFSKEERGTLGNLPPNDPEVLNYCSMDVQSLIAIRDAQIARSRDLNYKPHPSSPSVSYGDAFLKHVRNQMRNIVVGISHMEQSGSPIDLKYLQLLMSKTSPLLNSLKASEKEMRQLPSVVELERDLIKEVGRSAALFGGASNIFQMGKKAHQLSLFLNKLKLKPVNYTETGQPSIGKVFIKEYSDSYPEVRVFSEWVKTGKLLSAYVKGWYKKVSSSVDSFNMEVLRPGFGFFTIVTGRLNSFKPSLQQIPARGSAASYIKRMFAAPVGSLNIKYDYNAAEVRMASVLAKDKNLAKSFAAGADVKRKWLRDQNEELRLLLKRSDVHVQSVKAVFNLDVDKSHPLREAIKAIIFGVIYGKSVKTLAKDLYKSNAARVRDELSVLRKLGSPTEDKEAELEEIEERDWEKYADGVVKSLFKKWPALSNYLTSSADGVVKNLHVTSPIGRRRNLFRVLVGIRSMTSAARRRAQNAPIQGISSEMGCTAGYNVLKVSDLYVRENKLDYSMFPMYCRAVHDANYFVVKYEMLIPFLHIMLHEATTGVVDWYKEVFGMDFSVAPEIDIEISGHEENSNKWDYSLGPRVKGSLAHSVFKSLVDQIDIGRLRKEDLKKTLGLICSPWADLESRRLLQERWPILGLQDLDKEIGEFLLSIKTLYKEYING